MISSFMLLWSFSVWEPVCLWILSCWHYHGMAFRSKHCDVCAVAITMAKNVIDRCRSPKNVYHCSRSTNRQWWLRVGTMPHDWKKDEMLIVWSDQLTLSRCLILLCLSPLSCQWNQFYLNTLRSVSRVARSLFFVSYSAPPPCSDCANLP